MRLPDDTAEQGPTGLRMGERLHTAEHIIRTVVEENGYGRFTSIRLKKNRGRATFLSGIDLSSKRQEIEEKVNQVIGKDLPVKKYTTPRERADVINLDLVPESVREVTIYEIQGFNRLACKGPHVRKTGDVGKCAILSIEKKEGTYREYFIHYTVE